MEIGLESNCSHTHRQDMGRKTRLDLYRVVQYICTGRHDEDVVYSRGDQCTFQTVLRNVKN